MNVHQPFLKPNVDDIKAHLHALFPPGFVHRFPNAEIIVMKYYDAYAAADPSSLGVTGALNAAIAGAATKHRARTADAFTPFNLATPQPATFCGCNCQPPRPESALSNYSIGPVPSF